MKMLRPLKVLAFGLLLPVALSACFSAPIKIPTAPRKAPVTIANAEDLAVIGLDRLRVNFSAGRVIGVYVPQNMLRNSCGGRSGKITWRGGPKYYEDPEHRDVFNAVFKRANYNVVGDSGNLFAEHEQGRAKPRFLVGGQIEDLVMKVCDEINLWTERRLGIQSGQSLMRVSWQIFDTVNRKVVYKTQTSGSTKITKGTHQGQSKLVQMAFAAAAANLAADRNLLSLLKKKSNRPTMAITKVGKRTRYFPTTPTWNVPITDNIDQIRGSIVTIRSGLGHGSGFFISPSLIMTNNHVVDGNKFVKIKLLTGREITGEVLRKHPQRDVALIQVAMSGFQPLPIRLKPLKITEEVYAIGTPIFEELSGTVTKGIVSKFGPNEFGLEDIQADVDIQSGNSGGALLDNQGNVVGITYAGIHSSSKASIGINFFIPIQDALQKLNIAQSEI